MALSLFCGPPLYVFDYNEPKKDYWEAGTSKKPLFNRDEQDKRDIGKKQRHIS
jgi:hypothetical protein